MKFFCLSWRAWRLGGSLGLALGAGLVAAGACSTPSSTVDGGDLLGVFDRDAGADARSDAAGGKRDGGRDAGPAEPAKAPTPEVRAPAEGSCVAITGEPNRELRRTLGRPPCRDAQIGEWKDPEGSPRYACIVAPRGAETRAPLPLVVYFHGPDESPTAVDKATGLRKLAATQNLTGEAAHTGFVVLAPQGRALTKGAEGALFDSAYTGPDNVDVATVDHFVDELVAKGLVDKRRIYALGASFGGRMAATYAMLRADRVAAFATYASDAPKATWACPGPPPPAAVLYRACDDVVACDAVEKWLRERDDQQGETKALRLGPADEDEPHCALRNRCDTAKGSALHRKWPKTREGQILEFFARHILATTPAASQPPVP